MHEDETWVVWGGQLKDPDVLLERILDNEFESGNAVISVRWSPPKDGESPDEYLLRVTSEGLIKHGSIQLTTPHELSRRNFGLELDDSPGQPPHHYHVVFKSPVGRDQAASFLDAFSDPQPNPAKKK